MNRNEIYQHATDYLDSCGKDISVQSFADWAAYKLRNVTEEDRRKIFLCAIALIMDEV